MSYKAKTPTVLVYGAPLVLEVRHGAGLFLLPRIWGIQPICVVPVPSAWAENACVMAKWHIIFLKPLKVVPLSGGLTDFLLQVTGIPDA